MILMLQYRESENERMPSDFLIDLIDHKRRVGLYLQKVANALFGRAVVHDNSKFSPEEYEPYEEAFPGLQKYAYGTDEFKAELAKIKPAIKHHYENNDHHAEFFESGINDMNLIQLIEMTCDWIAASERSQTDIFKGLELNKERFGIDDQLYGIIKNTVMELTGKSDKFQPDPNTLYPDVLLTGPFEEKEQRMTANNDTISETHEWRPLNSFIVGETIHCWGNDLPVTNIVSINNNIRLYYKDIDGQEKYVEDRALAKYIARKRQ